MAMYVAAMQQLSGVNAINIYCGPILNHATSTEVAMLMSTLIIAVKLVATFFTTLIITRFGRKILLLIGLILDAVGTGMIAIGFAFQSEEEK
jgi:MFS family permease